MGAIVRIEEGNIPVVIIEGSGGRVGIGGVDRGVFERMCRGGCGTNVVIALGDLARAASIEDRRSAQRAKDRLEGQLPFAVPDSYGFSPEEVRQGGIDRFAIIEAADELTRGLFD